MLVLIVAVLVVLTIVVAEISTHRPKLQTMEEWIQEEMQLSEERINTHVGADTGITNTPDTTSTSITEK